MFPWCGAPPPAVPARQLRTLRRQMCPVCPTAAAKCAPCAPPLRPGLGWAPVGSREGPGGLGDLWAGGGILGVPGRTFDHHRPRVPVGPGDPRGSLGCGLRPLCSTVVPAVPTGCARRAGPLRPLLNEQSNSLI